MKIIQIFIDNQ